MARARSRDTELDARNTAAPSLTHAPAPARTHQRVPLDARSRSLAAASTSGASLGGDLMAAANVVVWVAYFIMAKRRRVDGVDGWSFLAAVFCWAAVAVVPFGLVVSNDLGAMTGKDWVFVLCMALGPGVVGHGLMTWSQSHLDVTLASILGLLGPVISTALAWAVFGESLTPVQMLGGAVVIGSLAMLVRD